MEYFDIAVITSYHQDVLAADWFFKTKEYGRSAAILTPNPNEYQMLTSQGVKAIYCGHYFPATMPSDEEVKKFFADRGVHDLEDYVATEKSYYFQSASHLIRYAYKYAYAFEQIYAAHKINTLLHPVQGGEVFRRAASLVAHMRGVNVIYLGESFVPGTINLYSDEWRTLLLPIVERRLSAEKAMEVINDKVNRKPVVFYSTEHGSYQATPMLRKIYTLVNEGNWNIIRAYVARKWSLSFDYMKKAGYAKLIGLFKSFDPTQKYFYYPFNVDAESELFIRNPSFVDQVAVIEQLAKVLPEGHKLYVKTHPGVDGHLEVNSYRRLKKLKNVVTLHAKVNSFDVVKHSQGVVMASSTVGLESYIMGKKTCIIGFWPYAHYGNFIVVKDFSETFTRILAHNTPNDPITFVQNVYRDTIDGTIYGGQAMFRTMIKSLFEMTYLKNA